MRAQRAGSCVVEAHDGRSEQGPGGVPIDTRHWATLARAALASEGITTGALGLVFVDSEEMNRLNLEHRSEDRATDVLAFPIDGRPAEPRAGPCLLGDVVVCPDYAMANMADYSGHLADRPERSAAGEPGNGPVRGIRDAGEPGNGPGPGIRFEDVLALLVVHGALHVLGYDHTDPAEAAVMQARERRLLALHHFPDTGPRPRRLP